MRLVTVLAVAAACLGGHLSAASAGEILKDRCSKTVAVPPSYNAPRDAAGTRFFPERSNWGPWSEPFVVQLGDGGRIRWWCNSTKWNILDPGTWNNPEGGLPVTDIVACLKGNLASCVPVVRQQIAGLGWTDERSRCGDRSNRIRVRRGPSRQLQMECLGKV